MKSARSVAHQVVGCGGGGCGGSAEGEAVASLVVGLLELGLQSLVASVGWQLHIVLASHHRREDLVDLAGSVYHLMRDRF